MNIEYRWCHVTVSSKNHQGKEQEEEKSGGDEGKMERKLSEINSRTVAVG